MRFIKNIVYSLCLASALSSCEKEVVVTLDNSADIKVHQTIQSYITSLSEAKYGWLVDVSTNEGYFQFLMHFSDDNMVTQYTDNTYYPEYNARPKRSTYNIRSLQRPTLSFDTYSYLAIINDPDNSVSGGSGNQGLETDFDFEIDSFVDGVFTMTGRINRVPAKMRRATESEMKAVESGGLMNAIKNLSSYNAGKFSYFTADGIDVSLIFDNRKVDIAYIDRDGKTLREATLDLHIRPTYDIELAIPFEVAGVDLTGFKWDAVKRNYVARVGSAQHSVGASDSGVIPFYKLFGLDRKYTKMTSTISIFDASNSNQIYRLFNAASNIFNAKDINISFGTNEKGNPSMSLTLFLSMGTYSVPVTYNYEIEYSADGSEFIVGAMTYGNDPYGYAELVDKQLYMNSIIRFWENRTFVVDWSSKIYNGWKVGKIVEKGVSANEFPGVFF